MEERKAISIGKLAAIERACALGLAVNRPSISALESEAREWKRLEEAEKYKEQGPEYPLVSVEPLPSLAGTGEAKPEIATPESNEGNGDELPVFHEVAANSIPGAFGPRGESRASEKKSETGEGFNWQPYESDQDKVETKPKNLNPASVSLIARKIMAREWAAALGRGRAVEDDKSVLERKAEQLRQKKEAEKEKKEIEEKRAKEQREVLEKALRSFGRALVKAPKPVTPETAEVLLEEAFTGLGEFISITWLEDGCHIFIEPWEEKRLRRKNGEMTPAMFQATVDDNLMLSSYERVENPELLEQTRNDLILKNVMSSFRNSPRQDLDTFEDAIAEGGRIVKSTKADGGWKTHFEPWHEVRTRNVERGGQPPIVTYVIKADKEFENVTCARGQ